MTARRVIYWDSCAFLALINNDKSAEEMQGCNDVWVNAGKGLIHIVTSTLTTAEVIQRKGAVKLDPAYRPLVSNFFRQEFISQKPLTREIAELARDVIWDSNIKPKDAIHVATCTYFNIRELHTFDIDLLGKQKIVVNGFEITAEKPHSMAQVEIPYEEPK